MVGFSNGGYFAALMASAARLKGCVSYYGIFTGANSDKHRDREFWNGKSLPLVILAG
jgi:dienelactone hydrolase